MIRSGTPPNVGSLLSKLVLVSGCHTYCTSILYHQKWDSSTRCSDACSFYLAYILRLRLHQSFVCCLMGEDVPVTDIHSTVEIATLMLLGLNNRQCIERIFVSQAQPPSSQAPIKPGGCGVWRKSSEYVGAMFHHRHPSFINPSPAQSSVAPQSLWGCPFGTGSMTRSATATAADSQKSKHQRRPATFHNILHHVWIDRQHVLGWTASRIVGRRAIR